jgi:hypothetical protein
VSGVIGLESGTGPPSPQKAQAFKGNAVISAEGSELDFSDELHVARAAVAEIRIE